MENVLAPLFCTPLRLFRSIEPHLTRTRLKLLLTNMTVLTIKILNTLDFFLRFSLGGDWKPGAF